MPAAGATSATALPQYWTKHIPLGAGSAPHGVIVGPDGAPWITDSGLNAIVRVDPESEKVDVHELPSHFSPDGRLLAATVGGGYPSVRLWDLATGRLRWPALAIAA